VTVPVGVAPLPETAAEKVMGVLTMAGLGEAATLVLVVA